MIKLKTSIYTENVPRYDDTVVVYMSNITQTQQLKKISINRNGRASNLYFLKLDKAIKR